ncbi:SMC-Scp complex subunit ScpB [Pseudahrensia aquimaris]|uniref:SMC-Scp complex subunit ScpB n=1 Tax=Pseudahrensia aquimaris TaxID=744461 RepID=A0ABW3FHC7_9HYPH
MSNTAENILPFPNLVEDSDHEDTVDAMQVVRMVEAMIFASSEPVAEKAIADHLPDGADVKAALADVQASYASRGINLVRVGDAWAFRTADDLSFLLQKEAVETRRLSKAALEVLAIIAYHQPVTRAEVEEIRGVVTSKGTLDVLLETGWVRMRGRRKTPGRPVTYGTTPDFLDHFGLETVRDLPGLDELKGAGMLQSQIPATFSVPVPSDDDQLQDDEDPFTLDDVEELGLLSPLGGDE